MVNLEHIAFTILKSQSLFKRISLSNNKYLTEAIVERVLEHLVQGDLGSQGLLVEKSAITELSLQRITYSLRHMKNLKELSLASISLSQGVLDSL